MTDNELNFTANRDRQKNFKSNDNFPSRSPKICSVAHQFEDTSYASIATMGKSKIAIFGTGGNLGKGLIPILVKENYNRIQVLAQKDETKSFVTRDDVIFRGDYFLERDAVITSMEGCSKVVLALHRTLELSELIGYSKFIGECAVAARVPTLIRLAVSATAHSLSEAEENFRHLDGFLDSLAIEVVTIQSQSMLSGRWEAPRIRRRKKRESTTTPEKKKSPRKSKQKTPRKPKKEENDEENLIGFSVTFDNASKDGSPDGGTNGTAPSSPPSTPDQEETGLWNYLTAGTNTPQEKR